MLMSGDDSEDGVNLERWLGDDEVVILKSRIRSGMMVSVTRGKGVIVEGRSSATRWQVEGDDDE